MAKPTSLFELSVQFKLVAVEVLLEKTRLVGAVGTAGVKE